MVVRSKPANGSEDFVFSVKVPQIIIHEKVLVDCDADFHVFLNTMEVLGQKLGPMVLPFPFLNRTAFRDRHEFLDHHLVPFLRRLPTAHRFAIEIRNRGSTLNWRTCCGRSHSPPKRTACKRRQRSRCRDEPLVGQRLAHLGDKSIARKRLLKKEAFL